MRAELLAILREQSTGFVSGAELSRNLRVSRTAVWKQVQALRAAGYDIEAKPRQGYRLLAVPDRLYPEEIQAGLETSILGREVNCYRETGSTNRVARELAEKGVHAGAVVVAESQTQGVGRLGRAWASPTGKGLWFSIIWRPLLAPDRAPQLTLAASVAVARAIEKETGVRAGIKWPNDLLVEGRKVCGILTELKAELDRIHYVIVGIGINANLELDDFPAEVRDRAVSLQHVLGRPVNRVSLLRACLVELESSFQDYEQQGFQPLARQWRAWNITLGRQVAIKTPTVEFRGVAKDIDDNGALIVSCSDGPTRIFAAGDVTLQA